MKIGISERVCVQIVVQKLDSVAPLIAHPFRCHSTNRQNQPIQKDRYNFWTNYAIFFFLILMVLEYH